VSLIHRLCRPFFPQGRSNGRDSRTTRLFGQIKPSRRAAFEALEARLALNADFTFLFGTASTAVTAPAGTTVSIPITAQISSVLDNAAEGAQGWSMSIQNLSPLDASITSAQPLLAADFEQTALTTGTGNEGVVHASVLSFAEPTVLSEGTTDVLELTLEGVAPTVGVTETWTIAFVDGLQGPGSPVQNAVTSQGMTVVPELFSLSIDVTGTGPGSEPLFEFLLNTPDTTITAPAGSSVSIPITAQINSMLTDAAEGAQGWSMSIKNESPADASIVEAASLVADPSFENTELTTGINNEGAVHAVALNAGMVLPNGTSDVLLLTLEGLAPSAGVSETWTISFVDGLQGSGSPVTNVLTSQGMSVVPELLSLSIDVTGEEVINEPLAISIDDVTILEGDAGTANAIFTASLSRAHNQPVTLDYVTLNGTAKAGLDFENQHGPLTFQPGQSSRSVVIPIIGDVTRETDETFIVRISNPSHGAIVDPEGQGTIVNDDALATVESVVINDGSDQRSTVHQVTVTFDGEVSLLADAFQLTNELGKSMAVNVSSSVLGGKTVSVLRFTGPDLVGDSLPDGNYTLTIHSDRVLDSLGKALDGDGDGINGGNRVDEFFRLFGDSDGDGDVDRADRDLFRRTLGTMVGDLFYLDYFDFDGDGDIDRHDRKQFNDRFSNK